MELERQEQRIYAGKYDSLESILSSFVDLEHKATNWMFLWCKADIRKTIINAPNDCLVSLEHKEQPVFTLKISQEDENNRKIEELYAICLPSKLNSLFMIVSDAKLSIFRRLIDRIIKYNYPFLSHVYLKDSEIKALFLSMNKQNNIKIIIYKILSYSRISETIQEKDLRWTRREYDDVFYDLQESNAWIKRIDFKASIEKIEKGSPKWIGLFEVAMGRDCYFKVRGDLNKFYEYMINVSRDMIARRLGYLQARSDSAGDTRPKPIVIRFDNHIFKEKSANEKFIRKLEELKNISITRIHVNPYLHISLVDYNDGSSYAIWIVSENEINIIPQIRATVASMTKLLNHIYQKIQEGDIAEYSPIEIA